jgi:hypothetical protein
MFLKGSSQTLFGTLKELLRKGKLSQNTINYLVVFVVAAIVLNGFIMTTFLVIMAIFKMVLRF